MKKATECVDADAKLEHALEISTIRGMCPGINTDVLNDTDHTQAADDLITSKAAARVSSAKRARKFTLDDL